MKISELLDAEWIPTLGCTEPAAIAYAAAGASALLTGKAKSIRLAVDARTYKNCFSVGIPRSEGKTGIVWAVAIGASLPESAINDELQCFKHINKEILENAETLIKSNRITVDVKPTTNLEIDCTVVKNNGRGRTVIKDAHSNIIKMEIDGIPSNLPSGKGSNPSAPLPYDNLTTKKGLNSSNKSNSPHELRKKLTKFSIEDILQMLSDLSADNRRALNRGMKYNWQIAESGLERLPKDFVKKNSKDLQGRLATLVCGGVYARMWGEELRVYAAAGSGNKGIVSAVPIYGLHLEDKYNLRKSEEALALSILITSLTTHHLGPLSAACGCSNAAGIGLAASLVWLEGGTNEQISMAINNMVGNVTGMICDGAKIGCALKTMTAVDAAFRASSLALANVGIPKEDGIVGPEGLMSLENVGRIACKGMALVDEEILKIMGEKI